ncbi:hypothetical protein FSP39_010221 [Pinctada imbricata]|uniref:Fibronectin type-III domain-containing protein n=1 Tax=Pinctada imbricata TaxID=66713 RepID=A0AA88Y3A4_PINIB|nr:hypothetical protein FSP39_010221 [Pinctada imbricata]
MTIEFDVLDLHSGIHSIQWAFGTTQHGTELGMGAKGVQRINGSCDDKINCYCPSVGVCEIFRYSIDLNPLVVNNTHIGQHHREYFFSVKATNNAQLVAIERIDILADDSPPEHGVVQEGRIGSSDVDFTSDDYVYVNWDGFIDHESGIKFYRVGLATTCLSQEILVGNETEGTTMLQDETGLSTRFDNITPNKYFTTVVAFNNAMEPSKAVCSDGITIDITQPLLQNVILEHARTREVIGCYNRRAFLFLSNLTVIPLIMTHECLQVCNSSDEIDFISALPVGFKSSNDSDVASAMCSKLPAIDANWFIYLPSDKIYMSWNASDLESQIRYVNIGFSSSATNVAAPDINGYQTVHSMTKLRKTHSGIDRGKLFYIMLKATNKADLDNVMKVGPIIIDETEPEYTSGMDVIILDSYIYCTWNNRTFFDTEQKEELTSFLFRIVFQTSSNDAVSTPEFTEKHKIYEFQNLSLKNNQTYYAAVGVCFDSICIGPNKAEPFRVETNEPISRSVSAVMESKGVHGFVIELRFEAFTCTIGTAKGYNVALFKSETQNVQITKWHTLLSTSSSNIQEKVEFTEAIYPHSEPMLCIQAVCRSGNMATSCVEVESKEHANNFNKNVLYEVESGHFFERNVKSLGNAANIGSELSSLHRIEADFIRPGSKIFGVILNFAERSTEWFLMRKRVTPSGSCRTDPSCIVSSVTTEGYCQFNTMSLKQQVKYFICAVSNRSVIQREHLTDDLEETSSCGNGFVIDSEAPDPGSVKIVSNSNGFLTDPSYVHIVWEGFSDIEKQVNVPTVSGIANYKLALGSYPGGEDLFPYHNVGLRQSIFISPKPIKDGTQCFASIRAIDHVGHMTEVNSDGVIMDSTPPVNGTVIVGSGLYHLSVISTKHFIVRWDSFKDPESGIRDFSISISESPNYTKSSHTFYSVTGDSFQLSETGTLLDGHTYFTVVEATNHAGLLSRSISEGFIIDSTAPEGGNVRDGLKDSRADLDFQEDVNVLGCYWDGFHDAHSKIISYEAGFGTKPSEFDITSQTNLGLHTQYIVHSSFTPGVKYYCTVIACNAASLCTTRTSDGIILDNSPPIPGIVRVGLSDRHQHYLGHSNLITAQWIGFQDPHSEIVHFKWCIGTVPSKCDVQDFQNCLLSDSITISNVKLREQTPYYITVEATNGVGLTTNRSSSSFMVDTTPPYMTKRPVFVTKDKCVSHRDYTQFDNSVLFIEWSFEDDESHIADQTIILRSHHNGHVVKEKTVLWNQKWVTLKLDNENLLRSGDRYTAWVTACNGAGICTTNSTEEILIDSSPPQLGGFHKGMKWRTLSESNTTFTELDLLWYGFTDVESGIVEYYVSISRNYSGAELSNGLLRVLHKSSNIQQTTVRLNETLQDTDKIVLSIWAENGVGLRSSVGKISVFLASSSKNHTGGFLEIERHSCDSNYCNFDCTCAVVGKKCTPPIKHLLCTNETDKQVTKINVTFGWIRTLSSSCLTLSWASENSSAIIKRYEWSLGIHNDVYGAGIFDTLHENIWNDVDKQNYVTHCLQYSRHLIHREKYVGYVRAWYSEDSYKIFTSLPILVDLTPPSIRKGASVLESIDGCVTDVDYMNSTYTFNICWRNVFVEREGEISKFSISGGTSPEGDDFLSTRDLPNSNLVFIITKPDMEKGKRYFFTITATNSLGLSSSKTSDGMLLDEDKPVSGVIYNTHYHRSVRFQSSTQIGASWHGFDDHQSFIHHYSIIIKESITGYIVASTDTVGLSNTLKFKNMHLTHGKEYHFEMSAFDAVGHISESVRSESVTIDTTPPQGLTCEDYDEGILLTPSNITQKSGILDKTLYTFKYLVDVRNGTLFKAIFNVRNSMTFRHLSLKLGKQNSILLHTVKKNNRCYYSEYQFISNGGKLLEMEVELFTDNLQTTLSKCGDVNQDTTEKVDVQQLSPTTFFVSSLVQDPESGIKEIIMSAGTTQSGYQILPQTHVSGMIYTFEAVVLHGTKLYPRAMVTNYAGLTTLFTARRPIVVDRTPPDIIVVSQNIEIVDRVKDGIENGSNIDNNVTSSAGLNNTMSTNNTNDNTALYIHLTSIKLKWKASDPESHLQDCLCSLGLFKGIQDVIGWTASEKENNTYTCSLTELDLNDGTTVFPSVKCINTVQLSNMINFEPMVVSYKAPVLSDAKIEFISQNEISADHETPIYPVQSNSSYVVFSWHGFHDESCHLTYETRLYQSGRAVQPWSNAGSRRLRSYDVGLGDWDNITVETRALNHGHIPSTPIYASISIQTKAPRLTGKSASLTRTGNNFRLTWTDVFVNDVGGPYVFTVTMGRRDGQTDVQRPISTTGFYSEITSEEDIKEVYVTIKAMSVTGHEAAYRKKFLV